VARGPTGAEVVDAEVDRARHARAFVVGLLEHRDERGQLEERAHHAAVHRGQRGVADEVVAERHDAHRAALPVFELDAEESRVRHHAQRLPDVHAPLRS
jgi:hypothetical protein